MSAWRGLPLAALVCVSTLAGASDYVVRQKTRFAVPERYTLVNDYGNYLRVSRQAAISAKLQALEKRNGTQIVLLSVPSVGEGAVWDYGLQVWKQWTIGNNGQGNGVLFLVADKGWSIHTGAGIAGAIPDVTAARISRTIMEPYWTRDQVSEGIEATVDALIAASRNEETSPTFYDYSRPYLPTTRDQIIAWVLSALALAYGAALGWRRWRRPKAPAP
jgi:uncharacterized protein